MVEMCLRILLVLSRCIIFFCRRIVLIGWKKFFKIFTVLVFYCLRDFEDIELVLGRVLTSSLFGWLIVFLRVLVSFVRYRIKLYIFFILFGCIIRFLRWLLFRICVSIFCLDRNFFRLIFFLNIFFVIRRFFVVRFVGLEVDLEVDVLFDLLGIVDCCFLSLRFLRGILLFLLLDFIVLVVEVDVLVGLFLGEFVVFCIMFFMMCVEAVFLVLRLRT